MSPTADPTLDLCLRARGGDEAAYERLFALAYDSLRLYVRLRLGRALRTRLESDDVIQDTFVEALRSFDGFRWQGKASFSRWICRVAENRIRALAAHHGARKRTPPGDAEHLSHVLDRVTALSRSLTSRVDLAARKTHLAKGLDELPDELRLVVLLRYFAGMSLDEIGDSSGTSRSTVRRQLGRATRLLGARLQEVA